MTSSLFPTEPEGVSAVTIRKVYESAKGAALDEPMEVQIDDKVFTARPHRVSATTLIDFQGLTVTRDPEAMWGFFRSAFGDDYEEFHTYINSPEVTITADTLGEIIKDMVEFTTGRPTEQSNS